MTNHDEPSDVGAFEHELRAALSAHDDTIDVSPPEFSGLLSARQRIVRRNVVMMTVALAVIGLAGVVAVTTRQPDAPVAQPLDVDQRGTSFEPSNTAAATLPVVTDHPPPPHPDDWFCTGPLGTDADGREFFADCGPIVEEGFVQWACTGRVGVDDVGRTRFASCEIATSPTGRAFEVVTPDDSVFTPTYTVRTGDDALSVATAHCVTLEAFEAANGWTDAAVEFPPPGAVILIPPPTPDGSIDC